MSSLVQDLQREALNSSVPVSDLLRKASIVARKLHIRDFEGWIMLELKGYSEQDEVPGYRIISGQMRVWNPYRGHQPLIVSQSGTLPRDCRSAR